MAMIDDRDIAAGLLTSYSSDNHIVTSSSSSLCNGIDYNLHSELPSSIYWGGCAFGSAFCKLDIDTLL